MIDQNKKGCWQTPEQLTKNRKQNNSTERGENRGLPQLTVCHLAVCWSWASYHTSSERGHPRLSADMRIWTFDQLIGIL